MTKQHWQKKGRIFQPSNQHWWSTRYGLLPTPVLLPEKNVIRIFYSTTDNQNNGRITFLDVDAGNPSKIVYEHPEFILDIGTPGQFDDSGVCPSSILQKGNETYLYYVGFQRCEKVPYMLFPGLAVSTDFINFKRNSSAPLIDRMPEAPYSNAAPFVLSHENKYKMWHWFGKKWIEVNGKPYLQASIGYSESTDGISWKLVKPDCIIADPVDGEFSVGRPWVLHLGNRYVMWYSVRHEKILYRIAWAESTDGINWKKNGTPEGLAISKEGWDSEMLCYPAVIKVNDKLILFYNGNENGKSGFGYAESALI